MSRVLQMRVWVLGLLVTLLAACAAQGPQIRTDSDRNADFSKYRTFGFPTETGTDRGGYSTLLTSYFKDAVRREMTTRGYVYAEQNPDLLVNFYANVREKTETRTTPTLGYGYYGYRYGLYTAWPLYDTRDVDTVSYRVGTVNIDVVDAARKQLIWEGIAEGRVSKEQMDNPQPAVSGVVTELFQQFPGRSNM